MTSRSRKMLGALALVGAIMLASPSLAQHFVLDRMFITFVSPPPPTAERYAQVYRDNLRVALEVPVDALPAVQKNRILAVLTDPILSRPWEKTLRSAELGPKLEAFVHKYREQPYVYGYYLADHPSAADFPILGEMAGYLREEDPIRFSYINLYPITASRKELGARSYEQYLDEFIRTVKPEVLSYDYFPFEEKGDGRQYFPNLAAVRKKCLEYGVPFAPAIQACKTDPRKRMPTAAEIRWQIWMAVAYGARGYIFYRYWGSPETGGLMVDGKPTDLYGPVMSMNMEMINTTPLVLAQKSTAVYHVGWRPPGTQPLPRNGEIVGISGGRFVVGLFDGGPNLVRMVLVNADYRLPVTAELRFRRRINVAKAWDHHIALWGRLQTRDLEEGSSFQVKLEPGDGRIMLVQLKKPG